MCTKDNAQHRNEIRLRLPNSSISKVYTNTRHYSYLYTKTHFSDLSMFEPDNHISQTPA